MQFLLAFAWVVLLPIALGTYARAGSATGWHVAGYFAGFVGLSLVGVTIQGASPPALEAAMIIVLLGAASTGIFHASSRPR